MRGKITLMGLLCSVSASWATLISDDFTGADLAQTAYTVNVGNTDWTQAGDGVSPATDWFRNANEARARNRASNAIMYNTALETDSGSGINFTLSGDVRARDINFWTGLVFNYQDASNYYFLRIKSGATDYQLIQNNGGSLDVLVNADIAGTFAVNTYYTFNVTSDTAGMFDFTIADGATTVASGSADDSASALVGGYAGFYVNAALTHSAHLDNFSLEVIPEPATLGMVAMVGGAIFFIRKRFMI